MSNQHTTRLARLAPAAGFTATAMIVASLTIGTDEDIDTILYRLGVALAMLAATLVVLGRTHATDRQIECIRQAAFDEGYADGCEVSRVVELRRVPSSVPPVVVTLPVQGAPHQLAEEFEVGRGADRVG